MTTENTEVKDVERIEIASDEGGETVEAGDTAPDSSQDENEGDDGDDSKKPDELIKPKTPQVKEEVGDGLANVEGETPKERALRLEITTLKGKLRQERGQEIFEPSKPATPAKKELAPEKAAVLSKYKPEEINSLREVLPVLAEEMGYVNKNDLEGATYAERSQEALDNFLDKHPEYSPENDKDGSLWGAFKTNFSLYKVPANPKDFAKIFDRIHKDVFGIQPIGALKTVPAQVEKIKNASHSGSSSVPSTPSKPAATQKGAYRLDMLKGFDSDEIEAMTG